MIRNQTVVILSIVLGAGVLVWALTQREAPPEVPPEGEEPRGSGEWEVTIT